MSIFYEEDTALQVKAGESFTTGERTNLAENASKAFKAFRKSEIFTSERNNQEEEYINIVDILTSAGHADIVSPLELEFDPLGSGNIDPSEIKTKEQLAQEFWDKVSLLQTTDQNLKTKLTAAGLNTFENMQNTIATKTQNAWKDYTETNMRATFSGKAGGFAGMAGAAFTDPIMLATIPISFGYSVPATFGKAAIKVALMEGIIGGVAETVIQLKAQPYRAELGFEDAGLETGIKNVGMVTAASATLSPLLLGVFKAFGKGVDVGKKFLHKQTPEDLQTIYKEMGEINPKLKDKDLTELELPKKDSPFEDTAVARTEHRERINTTARAIENGEPIDLPAPKSKIIFHSTNKKFDEFDLNKTRDQSIWFASKLEDLKSGKIYTTGKGNIIERFIDETKLKLAIASVKEEKVLKFSAKGKSEGGFGTTSLDKDLKAQGYDGVKFTKAEGYETEGYRIFNPEKLKKTAEVETVSKKFNQEPSKLADDQNNVKDFDVPNEATYRNQASVLDGDMFDEGTSAAIKEVAGAGSAAKTVPTDNPLAKTQDLVSKSQRTEAAPSSTVLATAQSKPPLVLGSITNSVGDFNSIGKQLYHKSDNFNEIYKTLSGKINDVKKELQPIATKYDGDLKARIKDKASLKEKLASDPTFTPQNMSDVLGTRIAVRTINEAKLLMSEINKKFALILNDDFLDDIGRTVSHKTDYRAIHAQILTKDGFSFELQIRLKELENLTEKSHAIYKKTKYQKDQISAKELTDLLNEQKSINKKLSKKYFEIKDKEFARLKSGDPLDRPIPVSQRLDDVTGEKIPLTVTAREVFEQAAKDETMLNRLKDCVWASLENVLLMVLKKVW